MELIKQKARKIKMLILDADGVMTDGQIYYNAQGEKSKAFYVQDGLGLRLLHSTGVKLALISGRDDSCVEQRIRDLHFDYYFGGVTDKKVALAQLLEKTALTAEECAFVGDDLIDLPILIRVGLAIAVPAASDPVREKVHYITTQPGGRGAIREVTELIMCAQGTFDLIVSGFCE